MLEEKEDTSHFVVRIIIVSFLYIFNLITVDEHGFRVVRSINSNLWERNTRTAYAMPL